MKMKRLFYALGIGCTLCACSSTDEPQATNEQDFTKSNKYVSVAIVTTSGDGTRAASDYDDGDQKEYDVNSIGFYFFDRQGNCVDTEYITSEKFENQFKDGAIKVDPAVTVMGIVEVELAANCVYDNVIAILNPKNLLDGGKLKTQSKTDLMTLTANYAGLQSKGDKGNFTMTNSVYVDDTSYTGGEEGFTSYVAVPITSHNIYTKTDGVGPTAEEIAEKAINIYVERICAKVIVSDTPSFNAYFVDKDGKETQIEILEYDPKGGKTRTITVKPEFKGMGLSVTRKTARAIKNLAPTLTYKFNDDITNFVWNDVKNKRTYWESTPTTQNPSTLDYDYTPWKDITNATLTEYINPNTVNATSFDKNEADRTTKLLVCAQLTYIPEGETDSKPLDIVKFSGGYWMADYLLYHAAQRAAEDLEHLVYTGITDETQLTKAKDEVKKINREAIRKHIKLIRRTSGTVDAYLAQLSIKENDIYPDLLSDMATGTLKTTLANLVNEQIQQTLDDITNRQIQYWKDGMTYFYVPIRHEGFNGLQNGKYLNGVVRNHVYQVKISKIWGLGTPVIEPGDPIDPERPEDAPDSYMTAKINVLKWRVVSSNVVMH